MLKIDNEEMKLIRPLQEQMDARRKEAWQAFTKKKRKLLGA